jgi:Cu(I)/Ag(I) efflux system membrane fusion protein
LSPEFVRNLQQKREVSQTVTFYSPQDGVIDNLNIREGFFVQPGTTLMSIGALGEVWVEAEVFERQAALVEIGMPVTMTLDFLPGREWQGHVDYIYPSLDEKTRTLRLRLRFDNDDGALRPNMFAQVMLHPADSEDTLLVPREAVIRVGNQDRVVLALDGGRFKSVAVKIGRLGERYTEILDGLAEGDLVVTSAQFLLDSESSRTSDFQRMQPATEGAPKTVWTPAKILSLMPGHRMVTAQHDAIAEWDWPAMTMDFTVAEGVDFERLREGLALHVQITRQDDDSYLITDIHIMNGEQEESAGSGEHHHD